MSLRKRMALLRAAVILKQEQIMATPKEDHGKYSMGLAEAVAQGDKLFSGDAESFNRLALAIAWMTYLIGSYQFLGERFVWRPGSTNTTEVQG